VILWELAGISVKHAAVAAISIPTWVTFGMAATTSVAALILHSTGQKLEPAA